MKKRKINIVFVIIAILIILGLCAAVYFLLTKEKSNNNNNINNNNTYCTEQSRQANVCIELYEPVCGFPAEKTYSNSCFACMNNNVEYYVDGEC